MFGMLKKIILDQIILATTNVIKLVVIIKINKEMRNTTKALKILQYTALKSLSLLYLKQCSMEMTSTSNPKD